MGNARDLGNAELHSIPITTAKNHTLSIYKYLLTSEIYACEALYTGELK